MKGISRSDRVIMIAALVATSVVEYWLLGLLQSVFPDVPSDHGIWMMIYLPALIAGWTAMTLNPYFGLAGSFLITFGILLTLSLCVKRGIRFLSTR